MHTPSIFDVRTTDRCNAACWFCSGRKKVRQFPSPDMEPEIVRQVAEFFPSIKEASVAGYGETLLGKHIAEICQVLLERRIRVTIITNGIRVVRMKQVLPWTRIRTRISMNEVNKVEYARTMNVDKLDEVIAGLDWLREQKAWVQLKFLVGKHNINRVPDYLRFAATQYPEIEIILGPISDYTAGANEVEWEQYALFEDDLEARATMMRHQELARSLGVRVLSWPRFIQRSGPPIGGCIWPHQHITVDGAGNVGSCCRMLSVDDPIQTMAEVGPAAWYAPGLEKLRDAAGRGGDRMPKECWRCIAR
jgi:molybdenum cofactor biosynthesis enzyme MoaA